MLKKSEDDKIAAVSELATVKEQLDQKSMLLDKVKVLLHRAAAKEKNLLQEVVKTEFPIISNILIYMF